MDEEEKTARVIALMRQTSAPAERPRKPLKTPPMLGKTVIIHGGWHHYAQPRAKVVVVISGELISKVQKAALVGLRDQWVSLHNSEQARQITRADARKALNDQAGVTAHRLIPADRYADLIAWLSRKIAILEAGPSAQVVNLQTRAAPSSPTSSASAAPTPCTM